jgi:hypothetical protein
MQVLQASSQGMNGEAQNLLKVILSAADILSLGSSVGSFFTLVPAPGLNKAVIVDSLDWNYNFGGTPFAGGSAVGGTLSTGAALSNCIANVLLAATLTAGVSSCGRSNTWLPATLGLATTANSAFGFSLAGVSFTGGNGTLTLMVRYHVNDVS